jgi:hypothetical protein
LVLVVSANAETLDGLQAYLQRAGVDARGTREIPIGSAAGPLPNAAVLLSETCIHASFLDESFIGPKTHFLLEAGRLC